MATKTTNTRPHVKEKLETAIEKAKGYTEEFDVDLYLVNFLSNLQSPSTPVPTGCNKTPLPMCASHTMMS